MTQLVKSNIALYHDVDSNELSFKMAAAIAFKEGLKNARPALLEPIHRLKIAIPSDYLGDVMGDINKRRGRIMGTDTEGTTSIVTAEVPLAEIKEYTMVCFEIRNLECGEDGSGKCQYAGARRLRSPDSNGAVVAGHCR